MAESKSAALPLGYTPMVPTSWESRIVCVPTGENTIFGRRSLLCERPRARQRVPRDRLPDYIRSQETTIGRRAQGPPGWQSHKSRASRRRYRREGSGPAATKARRDRRRPKRCRTKMLAEGESGTSWRFRAAEKSARPVRGARRGTRAMRCATPQQRAPQVY